jgi:hypothetical protein
MDQLLKISSIPINMEINVTKAELKTDSSAPMVHISKQGGGLQMTADPIKINIDNSAAQESLGYGHKHIDTFAKDEAEKGITIAYQAVARIANEGDALGNLEATPSSIAMSKAMRTVETVMDFLPKEGPDISWSGNTLSINYTADTLNMDWDTSTSPEFEFVPGSVEFVVNQLPKVEIEYIGEPIYFPRSANPNYTE